MTAVLHKLTKVTNGEETFWKELTFRCKYALGDVLLSSGIAVSGQDDNFENEGDGLFFLVKAFLFCLL